MGGIPLRRSSPRGGASEAEAVAVARPFIKQLERWHARVAYVAAMAQSGRVGQQDLTGYADELDDLVVEVEAGLSDLKTSLGELAGTSRGIDRVAAMQRLLDLTRRTRTNLFR